MINRLESAWQLNLTPPEEAPLWKWAEFNIVLSTRQATAFPGPYRTSITPYVRGIFDAMQDPQIHTIAVEKGAQTGLTLSAYIWLCFVIAREPGPILLVYPSQDTARSASETRMMPMIEDSPALRSEMSDDRDEWTKLQYRMKKCTVNWEGSNSPANLASRPIRYLVLDEVDKYPVDNIKEGSAVTLAVQRTKTFWNRKIFMISTPTTADGNIHKAYLDGDQRRFFIPCPKCNAMQFLVWPQVKFDSKASVAEATAGAFYECVACKAKISDSEKNRALAHGEWRPTGTGKIKGQASFHLSSLYAPWSKWGLLAEKFLVAKEYGGQLQGFINSELGEPYVHYDNRVKDSVFAELEGEYNEGEMWADAPAYKAQYTGPQRMVIAGVDVQKGYLMAVFRQFVRGGDSGLVWSGDVANLEALDVLAEKFGAGLLIVDARYRTREVQEWAHAHPGYIPAMGVSRRARALYTANVLDLDEGKRSAAGKGRKIRTLDFEPDMVKDILAAQVQRSEGSRRWLVPKGYALNVQYVAQMTAERQVNGRWLNPQNRPNHFWDGEVLALLGAIYCGIYGVETGKGAE